MKPTEPLLDVAHGDVGVSRHLTKSLRELAKHTDDPALRESITKVLSGKISVRELASTGPFSQLMNKTLPSALERLNAMSDDERQRLADEARARMDAPEVVEQPAIQEEDEPDDDEYFRNRGSILRDSW